MYLKLILHACSGPSWMLVFLKLRTYWLMGMQHKHIFKSGILYQYQRRGDSVLLLLFSVYTIYGYMIHTCVAMAIIFKR